MSVEIEAKMRLTDRAAVERRLEELGAEPTAGWLEVNTYFDTPQRGLKSSDQGLRVRTEVAADGKRTMTITHKGPRAHGPLKSRSECEVGVSDASEAATLLRALGYAPVLSFEKRRQRWLLGGCHVELDELPYLGEFIEIEGDSDDAVMSVREQLGLKGTPLIRASYIAMLMSYIRENQMQEQSIRFADPSARNGEIAATTADR
ncbi:MAG: class IV adenylate cyclase [Phycisphaeraceae bacterium]